jgi:hypothetical protein
MTTSISYFIFPNLKLRSQLVKSLTRFKAVEYENQPNLN